MKKLSIYFIVLITLLSAKSSSQIDSVLYRHLPEVLHTPTGDIFGTLTLPSNTKGGIPVVLIIAGSGPTDRDCNNPMMKNDAYKKIAVAFAANQIATLRYDKRGIAESKAAGKSEKDLRFTDYVKDAAAWIELIKSDKRFSEVIVLGHSEGSLIGLLATTGKVSKFISLAGISQSADKILKEQLKSIPDDLKKQSYTIIDTLVAGKEVENTPPQLGSLFRPSVQPYLISWFKENPVAAIAALKIPLLVAQGTADLQVGTEEARALAKANPRAQLLLVEDMNHVLRIVKGDKSENMETYSDPTRPLAGELVTGMCSFIKQK